MSTVRTVVFAALAAAALPAAAYQQTCVGTPQVCLKWPTSAITWKINANRPSAAPSCQPDTAAIQIAQTSFQTWQNATHPGDAAACTSLAFTYGGTTTSIQAGADSSEHVVLFREGWCSESAAAKADPCYQTATCGNKFDCFDDEGGMGRQTLALTSVSYLTNGRIVDADTEIVNWDGRSGTIDSSETNGIYVTCVASSAQCGTYGQADCAYYDLQNTLTHELGHFIGLAHPCEPSKGIQCTAAMADTTMYPYELPTETKKRDLSADDVNGVCTLYAAGQASTGTPGSSGGGCSTAPGFVGTTLLGLLALKLRRRP